MPDILDPIALADEIARKEGRYKDPATAGLMNDLMPEAPAPVPAPEPLKFQPGTDPAALADRIAQIEGRYKVQRPHISPRSPDEPSFIYKLRSKLGDETFNRMDDTFRKAGVSTLAWAHNVNRESGGNINAVGDAGKSHGLFQMYEKGMLGELIAKHGRAEAMRIARDPVRSAEVMAQEARKRGIHTIADPRQQTVEFTRRVERPSRKYVQQVEAEMRRMPGASTHPSERAAQLRQREAELKKQRASVARAGKPVAPSFAREQAGFAAPKTAPMRTLAELHSEEEMRPIRYQKATARDVIDPTNLSPIHRPSLLEGIGRQAQNFVPGMAAAKETEMKSTGQVRQLQSEGKIPIAPRLAAPGPAREKQEKALKQLKGVLDNYNAKLGAKVDYELNTSRERFRPNPRHPAEQYARDRDEYARLGQEIIYKYGLMWNKSEIAKELQAAGIKPDQFQQRVLAAAIPAQLIRWGNEAERRGNIGADVVANLASLMIGGPVEKGLASAASRIPAFGKLSARARDAVAGALASGGVNSAQNVMVYAATHPDATTQELAAQAGVGAVVGGGLHAGARALGNIQRPGVKPAEDIPSRAPVKAVAPEPVPEVAPKPAVPEVDLSPEAARARLKAKRAAQTPAKPEPEPAPEVAAAPKAKAAPPALPPGIKPRPVAPKAAAKPVEVPAPKVTQEPAVAAKAAAVPERLVESPSVPVATKKAFTPAMQERMDALGPAMDSLNLRKAHRSAEALTPDQKAESAQIDAQIRALDASRRNKLGSAVSTKDQNRITREIGELQSEKTRLGAKEYEPSVEELLEVYRGENSGRPWGWPGGEDAKRDIGEYIALKARREGKPVPPEVLAEYPDLAPKAAPRATTPPLSAKEASSLLDVGRSPTRVPNAALEKVPDQQLRSGITRLKKFLAATETEKRARGGPHPELRERVQAKLADAEAELLRRRTGPKRVPMATVTPPKRDFKAEFEEAVEQSGLTPGQKQYLRTNVGRDLEKSLGPDWKGESPERVIDRARHTIKTAQENAATPPAPVKPLTGKGRPEDLIVDFASDYRQRGTPDPHFYQTEEGAEEYARSMGDYLARRLSPDDLRKAMVGGYSQLVRAAALKPPIDNKVFIKHLQEAADAVYRAKGQEVPTPAPRAAPKAPAPKAEAAPVVAKEPWQIQKESFVGDNRESPHKVLPQSMWGNRTPDAKRGIPAFHRQNENKLLQFHREQVEQAVRDGKPVPPEVLAEYPDLTDAGIIAEKSAREAAKARDLAERAEWAERDKKPRAATKPKAPEPWQLSREDFVAAETARRKATSSKSILSPAVMHAESVRNALKAGKPVPDAVKAAFEAAEAAKTTVPMAAPKAEAPAGKVTSDVQVTGFHERIGLGDFVRKELGKRKTPAIAQDRRFITPDAAYNIVTEDGKTKLVLDHALSKRGWEKNLTQDTDGTFTSYNDQALKVKQELDAQAKADYDARIAKETAERAERDAESRAHNQRRAEIDAEFASAKFKKATFTSDNPADPKEISGPGIGGLVVHKVQGYVGKNDPSFTVSHAASGKTIGVRAHSQQLAKIAAYRASRLLDFTRPGEEVLAEAKSKGVWSSIKALADNPYAAFPEPTPPPAPKLTEKTIAKAKAVRGAAQERIKKRGGKLTAGLDPEDLRDYGIIGGTYLVEGVARGADWTAKMVEEWGEEIRPHLKAIAREAEQAYARAARADAPEAAKAERGPVDPDATGLANQVSQREVDAGRLTRMPEKGVPRGSREAQEAGEAFLKAHADPIAHVKDLAKRIADEERPFSHREAGILLAGKARLVSVRDAAAKALDAKKTPETEEAYQTAQAELQAYADDVMKGSTEWHSTGMALQAGVDVNTGNYAEVIEEAKRQRPVEAGPVPAKDEKFYEDMAAKIKAAEEKLAASEARNAALEAEKIAGREAKAKPSPTRRQSIQKEREAIFKEIDSILKEGRTAKRPPSKPGMRSGATTLPAVAYDAARLTNAAGKIAVTYMKEGVAVLDEVIAKTIADLKAHGIHATYEQVVDDIVAIGKREPQEPNALKTQIAKLKSEARRDSELRQQIEKLKTGLDTAAPAKAKELTARIEALENERDTLLKGIRTEKASARLDEQIETLGRGEKLPKGKAPTSDPALKAKRQQRDEMARILAAKDQIREWERQLAERDYDVPDPRARKISEQMQDLQWEKRMLHRAVLQRIADQKLTGWQRGRKVALDIANTPRTLLTSADMSAPLRQGLLLLGRPRQSVPAFARMTQAFFRERTFRQTVDELDARPNAKLGKRSGLFIADRGDERIGAREEDFIAQSVKRIPGIGHGVKASERAYLTYLNKVRADVFDSIVAPMLAEGKTFGSHRREFEDVARYVNWATGRGGLGPAEGMAGELAAVFFSPRFQSATLAMLSGQYLRLSPVARKAALRDVAVTAGGIGTILGLTALKDGAAVETDPRSTDFLKIRMGQNRRVRVNLLGGFQPYMRAAAQFTTGQKKGTESSWAVPLDRGQLVGRMVRSKLAPTPGLAWDATIGGGKDPVGEPMTPGSVAWKSLVPMHMQDLRELSEETGPVGAGALWLLQFFGGGVQVYKEKWN